MRHYLLLFVIMTLVFRGLTQDIVFPKDEESTHLSGNNPVITERIPVFIPDRCPENMLLYPGLGDKSSWVCDCKLKFLYFPLNNTCHEAYRQGPCEPGYYVHLPENDIIPVCGRNPCHTDGVVPFRGGCYNLGVQGPCNRGYVVDIDVTIFQTECIPLTQIEPTTNIPTIVNSVIGAPKKPCPPGTQRIPSGSCRTVL